MCKAKVYEKECIKADEVEEIEINTPSVDVNIVPSNSNDIVITLAGKVNKLLKDKYDLQVNHHHTKLNIDCALNKNILGLLDIKLQVEIPNKILNRLQVKSSSGDTLIKSLKFNEVIVDSNSGDQTIINTDAKKRIVSNATSGDIQLRDSTTNRANLMARSGDIVIQELQVENATFKTSSGDINLNDEHLKTNLVNFNGGFIHD